MAGVVQRGRLRENAVDLGLGGNPVDVVADGGPGLGDDVALGVKVEVVLADLLQLLGRGLGIVVHLGPGKPRLREGTRSGRSCLGIPLYYPDVHRPSYVI